MQRGAQQTYFWDTNIICQRATYRSRVINIYPPTLEYLTQKVTPLGKPEFQVQLEFWYHIEQTGDTKRSLA